MTASDIVADAVRLTKAYAETVAPVPDLQRVYVLTRNLVVLGVFKSEDQAVHEAMDLMMAEGHWTPFAHTTWTCGSQILAVQRHKVQ